MMRSRQRFLILLGSTANLMFAGTALATTASAGDAAQATVASPSGSTSTEPQLEEIIVQARRTTEKQQAVPLAISTVSGNTLQENAASSIADIKRLVPSLQITPGPSGQQDFTIRGSFAALGVDPAVATYIDDVPIDSRTLVYDLYDLESVQQLKGPQGTLFGRNTTGGAVLFYSRKPVTSDFGGYINARYGNLDEKRVEGALNVPLGDTFAFRVAGEIERRDGLLHSVTVPGLDFQNRHNSSIRISARWNPTSDIENMTQFTHYRVRERRYPQVLTQLAGPCTGPTTPAASCLYQPPFNSFLGLGDVRAYFTQQQGLPGNQTVNNYKTEDNVDRDSVTNSFTWDFGKVSFRNITYYGDTNISYNRDFDGTPIDVLLFDTTNHTKTFYTETQLYGKLFTNRLDWRVGVVYSRDKSDQFQAQQIFQTPFSTTSPKDTTSRTDFKSKALFGQLSYDMSDLVKGLSATAGYRYTWDNRNITTTVFQGVVPTCGLQTLPVPSTGPAPFPGTNLSTCSRDLNAKFSDSNYNFTLDWKPAEGVLLYATTRKGYKSGSFNIFEPNPALAQYQPEVVKDIEVGFKADWRLAGVPIRTNVAAFQSKYTNIQSQQVNINQSTGDITIFILNQDPVTGLSTKATVKGLEIEVTAALTSWLKVSGFYTTLEAKYDRYILPGTGIDLAGQNVGNNIIPETFGLSAQLNVPMSGPIEEVSLNGSFYHGARALSNSTSTTVYPPINTIDARLALRGLFGTGAELAVFGKNLANKDFVLYNPIFAGALSAQRPADPRTYGVELTFRFGSDR